MAFERLPEPDDLMQNLLPRKKNSGMNDSWILFSILSYNINCNFFFKIGFYFPRRFIILIVKPKKIIFLNYFFIVFKQMTSMAVCLPAFFEEIFLLTIDEIQHDGIYLFICLFFKKR